jgi:hypothetical protein
MGMHEDVFLWEEPRVKTIKLHVNSVKIRLLLKTKETGTFFLA